MDILAKLKQSRLVHLCFAISFFTSGLIINFAQLLAFVFIKPWNKKLYRSLMYYLCYSFYSQLVFVPDWWAKCNLHVYADPDDLKKYIGHEHGILIMNHSYEIDWLIGWKFCEKIRVLGNCKAYAKKAIQYIPTIGWSWKFAEFVFLERSFEKDKEIIGQQITEIMEYPSPVWLLLNAEGTRFTPAKHEASLKFARERNMTELKYHLIPRTKGFTASLPFLRAKCPALYDCQLAFGKDDVNPPTMMNLLFGKEMNAHLYVRRVSIASIPEKEEEAAEWLHELFRRKDKMQESFHLHGDFFKSSNVKPVPVVHLPNRMGTLLNTLLWAVAILTPMLYYLARLLLSGELLYFCIGAGILTIFYMLMQHTLGMSKIGKGSSYGSNSPK